MTEQWVEGFQANAPRIIKKLMRKIKDEADYYEKVVGVILKRYPKFINPSFISRSGLNSKAIIQKISKHLQSSYEKYKKNLDRAYETVDGIPAKRFKEAVAAAKEHYAKRMREITLPFTGTKAEGLGIAPIVALWLTEDTTSEGVLRRGDELLGGALLC